MEMNSGIGSNNAQSSRLRSAFSMRIYNGTPEKDLE